MSWIAVLLLGVAVTDLVRSVRETSVLPEVAGAAVAVFAGLAVGLTGWVDLVALLVIAGAVVVWGRTTWSSAYTTPASLGAWVPLTVLGGSMLVGLLLGGLASPAGGVFGRWLAASAVPVLSARPAGSALLLVSVGLVQLSTGNVLVRLVLDATGTVNPADVAASQPQAQLRGGRLLGPMERLFILGLGVAGHATAAAIVIAAKGLLRFPELQSKTRNGSGPAADIDKVTEYFLVGSFVSWLVALGSLVLIAG